MIQRKKIYRVKTTTSVPVKKTGRYLITVDNKPIRRKAISGCKKILKKYDSVKKQIHKFENEDKQLFTQWFNSEFGSELSQIREIKEENKSLEEFIKLINIIKYSKRISFNQAYVIASELKNNSKGIEEYLGSENNDSSFDENEAYDRDYSYFSETENRNRTNSGYEDDCIDDDDFDDDFDDIGSGEESFLKELYIEVMKDIPGYEKYIEDEELFEKMFTDFKRKFSGSAGQEQPTIDIDDEPKPDRSSNIKALYRSLVIQLHPDNSESFDPEKAELWYRIQDAYTSGDMEKLEMLSALNQIRRNDFPSDCPVSHILNVYDEYNKQIRVLNRLLKDYKSDLAWNFSHSDDDGKIKLSVTIRKELKDIYDDEASRQLYLNSILEKWSTHQMSYSPIRKKRTTAYEDPAQQELPFLFDE